MTLLVTVEVDTSDREAARLLGAKVGRVTRVALPTIKAGDTTPPSPDVRASALLDRPAGLDKLERQAYSRGYATACMRHVKKYGVPRGETIPEMFEATREAEWTRHPAAHKQGMTELMRERLHPSRVRGGN